MWGSLGVCGSCSVGENEGWGDHVVCGEHEGFGDHVVSGSMRGVGSIMGVGIM